MWIAVQVEVLSDMGRVYVRFTFRNSIFLSVLVCSKFIFVGCFVCSINSTFNIVYFLFWKFEVGGKEKGLMCVSNS